jgi:N-acetyl-alpha-D-muramate 1-phosphate uridylyltransferase
MKAMILAAGKGTRLGLITGNMPKSLVDINGKSILQIAVEKCSESGFDDIIINVHHFADMVEEEAERIRKSGYRITISDERGMLLETGGGLFRAKDFFDNSPFLLYNTDILTDLDITAMYRFHKKKKGLATLAVRNRKGNRYFLINSEGMLSGWCNKATGERIVTAESDMGLMEIAFSGMHIVEPEIFNHMREGIYTMTSLYLDLAAAHKIFTYRIDSGYWFDIGTPEDLENARKFFTTSRTIL